MLALLVAASAPAFGGSDTSTAKPPQSGTAGKKPAEPAATPPKPADAGKPAAAPGGALPLAEVVARMQKKYDSAKDFRAKFTQKYTSTASGREKQFTGSLLVKKPGRMRWDYEKPDKQMYLATGQTLWFYEPEEKQAYKQDLKSSQLPAAVSFLMGHGKLSDEFEIAFAKELPHPDTKAYRLALTPKKPQSTYRAIYFLVDPATFLVSESILINAEGDVNSIAFTDVQMNTGVADDLFKWSPPAGVRVIEGGK
jgi:outer membrane lipoprotein carrier protein